MTDRLSDLGLSVTRVEAAVSDAHFRLQDIEAALNAFQASFTLLYNQQGTIIELLQRLNQAVDAEPEESELPELLEGIIEELRRQNVSLAKLPKEVATAVQEVIPC
jgi:hypothetical protein